MFKKMLAIIILIIAITLLGTYVSLKVTKKPVGHEDGMPPVFVETQKVVYSAKQEKIKATGTVVAIPGIVVHPEVSGRVTKIYFQSGDEVKVDAPLIEINPDTYKANLAQSEANLVKYQADYDRALKLFATHTISQSDLDTAKANFASTQAQVEKSRAELKQTFITASFAGRLGLSLINVGDFVEAGQTAIVSLQSLHPIYVDFSVSEIYLKQVAVGQEVVIRSDSYSDEEFVGKVAALDPRIDENTRSLKVRAAVPNESEKLLPGAFAEVTLLVNHPQQVIKIPQTAIVYDAQGNYVYRVIAGKAVKTSVIVSGRDEQNLIVKEGLVVGDEVVTAGQLKIPMDGAPVVVANGKSYPQGKDSTDKVAENSKH
jgi:membrane fusion protein, multidrug efflux system